MAGLRNLTRVFKTLPKNVIHRGFASSSALRGDVEVWQNPHIERQTGYDMANPIPHEREETGVLPDAALVAKEQGPWSELTKEDRIALYRAHYTDTIAEALDDIKGNDTPWVVFGTSLMLSVSLVFFVWVKKYVGPTPPYTFTPEWLAEQEERDRAYRSQPITGSSSPAALAKLGLTYDIPRKSSE